MERTSPLPRLAALVAAGALVLAACGDDDADDATGTAGAAVTTPGSAATAAPGTTAPVGTTAAPGDIYAVPETTSGAPATDAPAQGAAPFVTTATTDLGEVLVGEGGLTVYGFTPDEGGTPTCLAGCASNWPPVLVDSAELPEGLDPAVFSVVEYPEGGFILRAGDWPLYYFAGDVVPGDTNGQGINGIWFMVDPAGDLVQG